MKNFQQNLLIAFALGLCGLCVFQWHGQTIQRNEIQILGQRLYERSIAVLQYSNSVATLNHQIDQMDARITELKAEARTNADLVVSQRREISRFQAVIGGLTNEVSEYRTGLATLEAKLKEAYEGIQKQNQAMKDLVAQRDEFVAKFNDSVKDRNEVVNKYNDLVRQVEKNQTATKP